MAGYVVTVADEEIDEVLNVADEAEEKGTTAYSGMTYEQGVAATIRWMSGMQPEPPLP